jgi:hypothetical protein
MSDMVLFDANQPAQLPAHLQGLGLNVTGAMAAVIGDQRNRIGLKGSRFRQVIAGQEVAVWEENYLDVIIVGVVPTVSRLYYANKYSQDKTENKPPTCYSVDNVAPPIDLPTRQSDACETCQWNVKGSKIGEDGHEGKACGYFRRMAVMLAGDPEGVLYYIDVKSQGLFGESDKAQNKYSMNDYAKFLQMRGVDASQLVTRLSFDTDSSTPKLLFKPFGWITPEDVTVIQGLIEADAIKEYLDINMRTVDISRERTAEDIAEGVEEAEAPEPAPATPTPKPVATAQTRPQPAPATAPRQQATPAPKPVQTAAKPVAASAPKPVSSATAKPIAQAPKPVQQAAKPTPVAAKPTPVANKPVPVAAKPAPVQIDTGIAPVQEVNEAGLEDLLGELGITI